MFCLILVMQTLQHDVVTSPCAGEGSSLPHWPYMAFICCHMPALTLPEYHMHFILCELSTLGGKEKVSCKRENYLSTWNLRNERNEK